MCASRLTTMHQWAELGWWRMYQSSIFATGGAGRGAVPPVLPLFLLLARLGNVPVHLDGLGEVVEHRALDDRAQDLGGQDPVQADRDVPGERVGHLADGRLALAQDPPLPYVRSSP
ncbi:hypothetical protein ACFVT1_38550 [Streptomyces sp. NPDC057963]|uniref:hypothetical protein n=1 Tax=Streptomyces sp. NPDC057963 TaxID=3346290 RepID=UPI0036E820EC